MAAFSSCQTNDTGDDPTSDVTTPSISSVVVDQATITASSASIEVAYADIVELNYSYYVVGDDGNALSDSVEVNEESTSYTISISDLEANAKYQIDIYGVDAQGVESSVESKTFQTLIPENDYYNVSNFVITPSAVTFELTLKDGCEGVALYACETAYFIVSDINTQIENGYATVVTESTIVTLISYANPSTSYNYIIVPVENISEVATDWGGTATSCNIVGSIEDYYVGEVTTGEYDTDFVVNNAASDTVEIGTITADITQFTVNVNRNENENVVAAYCGAVMSSELGDMTVAQWAIANKYFNTAYATYFVTDYYTLDTITAYITNLSDETQYTIFVVPVTASGAFGTITTAEATTNSYNVTVNEDLKPTVEIAPGLTSATVNITFGDCVKVYYDEYSTTLDNAKTNIYQNAAYGSFCFTDSGSGTATYTISGLSSSTEYKFYCMGVDADGVYGAVCEYTYTTSGSNWDGTTTSTVTQKSGAIDEYGFASVVFNIDISDDTYKATYAPVHEDYISYDIPLNWGKYILANTWYNQTITEDSDVTVTIYDSGYKLVVVTEDAAGAYGSTPVVVDIDWDALDPYVAPDATDE